MALTLMTAQVICVTLAWCANVDRRFPNASLYERTSCLESANM